jgi:hypothetical protein
MVSNLRQEFLIAVVRISLRVVGQTAVALFHPPGHLGSILHREEKSSSFKNVLTGIIELIFETTRPESKQWEDAQALSSVPPK